MDALGSLAPRRGVDVDLALERIVGVGEPELALAAAEERLEHAAEVPLDGGEGLEEHGARGAVDLPDGLDQRLARADQVVALGGEELEALHLLRMLLDGERVDRADGLERADDARGLRLQRLEVEVEQRRLLDQLLERPAPLGLDPLHDAPAGAGGFGEPHLQAVALLAARRRAPPAPRRLRARPSSARPRPRRAPSSASPLAALELVQRHLALGARFPPLGLLARQRGGIGLELRQLAAERLHRALGLLARGRGALQPLLGRPEPAGDVGFLHLPVHPLLARRLLLGLQLAQPAAPAAELLVEPAPRQVALDERGVDLGQALLGRVSRSVTRTSCGLGFRHLAGEVADDAGARPRAPPCPGARPRAPGPRRRRPRPAPARARRAGRPWPASASSAAASAAVRPLDVLAQRRELGPTAERARRCGRAREEDGAARAPEDPARGIEHLGPGERGAHPAGRRAFDPQPVVQRLGRPARDAAPGSSGSSTSEPGCWSACHACTASTVARSRTSTACIQSPSRRSASSASSRPVLTKSLSGPSTPPSKRSRAARSAAAAGARPTRSRSSSSSACRRAVICASASSARRRSERCMRLLLARLGDEVPRVLGLGGGPLGLVAQEAGALDRVVAPALGAGQLALEVGPMRRGPRRALAERRQLALERRPLALERAQRLGLRLQLLLPLADLVALLGQSAAHVLLGLGPAGQLGPDALVLHAGGVAIGGRGLALHQRLLRPQLHLASLLLARGCRRAVALASRSPARARSPSSFPISTRTRRAGG